MQLTDDLIILEKRTRHNFNWWLYSALYETLHGKREQEKRRRHGRAREKTR